MAAHRSPVFDLAMLDAVEEAIVARRDVLRATIEVTKARKSLQPSRISGAVRSLDLLRQRAAVTRSNLDAAIVLEAEARA